MSNAANKTAKIWGKPGDTVTGRTSDGRKWSATVGPSGKLIGKTYSATR